MERLQKKTNNAAGIQSLLGKKDNRFSDYKCRECSIPSCHDPVWNDSYCQFNYNEEYYLSK